jgi:hypothetical protein
MELNRKICVDCGEGTEGEKDICEDCKKSVADIELKVKIKELENKSRQVGRLESLIKLKEKIQEESVLREITLDSGWVFNGKILNTNSLIRIIDKMIDEV